MPDQGTEMDPGRFYNGPTDRSERAEQDKSRKANTATAIRVVAGDLEHAVSEGETALITTKAGIYQRGAFIVRAGIVRVAVSGGRKIEAQRIIELGKHGLLEALTTAAPWERYDGRSEDWVLIDAPMKVVEALRDRGGHWKLPVLAGIVNSPTIRADGSILSTPGYDEHTGLLFAPQGNTFATIPDHPSRADAVLALDKLRSLVATFPFVADADRSVALSAILTAVARPALPTAPMHAFTAPVPGSGKTMLVDLCSAIANGREASVMSHGGDEKEFEKRLASMLLSGDTVIAIDNIEQPLGGEFLCSVLTSVVVRPRILGRSQTPEVPSNAFITSTGNNLTLQGDITRRALFCRLDPRCERPELRVFSQNPVKMVKADQGSYLGAALTILRAFHVIGKPKQKEPLGSFEDWSGWVRGALVWLGQADPVETMEFAREMDPALAAVTSVISQWQSVIGRDKVSVKGLIERATKSTTDAWGRAQFDYPDFREALLTVAGAGGAVNSERCGKWLRSNKDRVVEGFCIVRAGVTSGTTMWQLLPIAAQTSTSGLAA